jgi:hypothetical protein
LLYANTADKEAEALEVKGRPIPAHLYHPEILPGLEPWLLAFWELSSDRAIGGHSTGPIPAASIARECADISPEEAAMFRRCMRAMDKVYLAHLTSAADKPKKVLTPEAFMGLMK